MVFEDYKTNMEEEGASEEDVLNEYKKKLHEESEVKVIDGRTVADILRDKEQSGYFGEMLKNDGEEDLAKRIAEGKLDSGDILKLEEKRVKFNKSMEDAVKVEKFFTPQNIKDLVKNIPPENESLRKIVNMIGPANVANIMHSRVKYMSVSDQKRFFEMSNKIGILEDFKNGSYKILNEKIKELVSKRKIDTSEYVKVLMIPDEEKREAELRKMIEEKYSSWENVLNTISLGKLSKADAKDLASNRERIEAAMKALQDKQSAIGKLLATTFEENAEVRKALSEVLKGNVPEKINRMSFVDLKEVDQELRAENKIDLEWGEYKEKINWKKINETEKSSKRDQFIKEKIEKLFSGKHTNGIWYELLKVLAAEILSNKLK